MKPGRTLPKVRPPIDTTKSSTADAGPHGGPADSGFSMIEVSVGIGLFAIVAVLMGGFMASGLRGVMLGKQRSAATADVNQVLETARSLTFDQVGLASDDTTLDADPAITTITPTSRTYNGEPVVFATSTVNHPFKPHTQTVQRSPSTLTRSVYVTGVDTNGDGSWDVKRVTVVVAWERSPVAGVSNAVTAATLVAANSPGTPGNPPQGSQSYPPLFAIASGSMTEALLEAEVGSDSTLDSSTGPSPATLRVYGPNGNGDNRLDTTSVVNCGQQHGRLEGQLAGAPFGQTSGETASTRADSTTNYGPYSQTKNQSEYSGPAVPGPLSPTISTLVGGATCTASGVTSGSQLPSEVGATTLGGFGASIDTSSVPLNAGLGKIVLLSLLGGSVAQSTAQGTDPNGKRVDAAGSHAVTDVMVMQQTGLLAGMLDMGAPEGLVHIGAYSTQATAFASPTTGTPQVTNDPAAPLQVKVWMAGNPANLTDGAGLPVTCDQVTGGYCVLNPTMSTGRVVNLTAEQCLGLVPLVCLDRVHVEATVTVRPAITSSTTLADGVTRVYRAEWSPVNVVARMWATNDGTTTNLFDIRTTAELGRVLACAKYGVYPGGCP